MPYPRPTDVALLKLWLTTDALIGYADGDTISTWPDQSGNGYDLTAGTAPTYKVNQLNGRPIVRFDGVDDYLTGTTAMTNLINVAFGTVFVVFNVAAVPATKQLWTQTSTPDTRSEFTSATNLDSVNVQGGGGGTQRASKIIAVSTWYVHMWRNTGSAIQNGLDDPIGVSSTASGSSDSTAGFFRLGANSVAVPTIFTQIDIAEVLIYRANLSDVDTTKVFVYLLEKWGTRGDPIEQARNVASRRLDIFRQPRLMVDQAVPLSFLDSELLDDINVSHPLGPGTRADLGWGIERWRRRPMRLQEEEIDLDGMTVKFRLGDLRRSAHTYRETGVPLRAMDAKREGVAISGIGAARAFSRLSPAWTPNPGSCAIVQVPVGLEKVSTDGILIETAVTNRCLRSSFVSGTAGLTLVGTGVGGSAIAATSSEPLLYDTAVTPQCLKFTAGTPHSTALYATWPAITVNSSNTLRLSIDHLDSTGTGPLNWRLLRSLDSFYWNDSSSGWQAASVWNSLTATPTTSTIVRNLSNRIVTAATTTLTLNVGLPSSGTDARTAYAYHVQVENDVPFATTRIVTNTATTTRDVEQLRLYNISTRRVFPNTRGTFLSRVTPQWDAADVAAAGSSPTIFRAHHDASNFFELKYASGSTRWEFIAVSSGTTATAFIAATPASGTQYDIATFWTSTEGELGLANLSIGLIVDGVIGTNAIMSALPAESDSSVLYIGSNPSNRAANASLVDLEFLTSVWNTAEVTSWGST